MKKALLIALVAIFVLALAGTAFAETYGSGTAGDPYRTTVGPTVIDTTTVGAEGQSAWTYKDLHDVNGKYEGGYAPFDNAATDMYDLAPGVNDAGPHGGYNSTTNKCKVCHAVHRAEGAYYLLRADSQDDACSYCHIGSAHSTRVVYDLNPDGIYTTNGHTIGAQTQIPDSTTLQTAEAITLSTTDAGGNPLSEVIHVRKYDTAKNEMFRFARHHGQAATSFYATPTVAVDGEGNSYNTYAGGVSGAARGGYMRIGPLALRCMNCHQPHNAVNEVWRPRTFAPFTSATYSTMVDGAFMATGYKLLRRSPAGAVVGNAYAPGATDPLNFYGGNQIIKAVEDLATKDDTATPAIDGNFSGIRTGANEYVENGVTRAQPIWIAQDIHNTASANASEGVYRYPAKVNNMALSWWCADCHNLNIGGWEPLTDPELGFKAHTERTHPAPFYGAYTGPGQCYSCHRNDLAPQMGLKDAANPVGTSQASLYVGRESCTQCHYGTADYYVERGNPVTAVNSDFPHSGSDQDIKMLGAYSVSNTSVTGSWAPTYTVTAIDKDHLDTVCLRCHLGIGVNH